MNQLPPPSSPPPIEHLAIHEAAHAVIHIALGQRPDFEYVSISSDKYSWGHLKSRSLPESIFEDKPCDLNCDFLTILREIMIFLAGDIAESRCRQEEATIALTGDVTKATELAKHCVCTSNAEVEKFIEWAFEKTKNLVNERLNWIRIRAVAQELISLEQQKGKKVKAKLSYPKVKAIIETALV